MTESLACSEFYGIGIHCGESPAKSSHEHSLGFSDFAVCVWSTLYAARQ